MVDVDKMETATVDHSEEKTTTPRFFQVNSLIRLVDKQEFEVEFQVLNLAEGAMEKVIINRTDISPKFIKHLIVRNGGVCIDADKACKVVEDEINQLLVKLYRAEGSCKSILRYKHQTLGWRKRNDEVEFCADKIYRTDRVVESEYAGAYKIQPIGTMDNIISMAKRCILGHTPLEAAVAAGVAATVLSYSNLMWGTSMDNPILHLSGTSTTGKSTVAKAYANRMKRKVKRVHWEKPAVIKVYARL